jgi:two-component system, sensor histidine kinase and response regulator
MQWIDSPSEWLAAIVGSSEDAIVGKTLDSVIRSWNDGAVAVFGYSASEIIGQSVLVLIPPELHHEEKEIVARLSRGERIRHFETVRVRKDRTRIDVSLSVSPIRDRAGKIVGAAKIARDMTETNRLRQAERDLSEELQTQAVELEQQIDEIQVLQADLEISNDELRQALEIARRSQRDAEEANLAKTRFLATMSHELRTPLNAIGGYVDLMQLGLRGPLTPEQHADLERIRQNRLTLQRLVEDVLGFAKLESGRTEYHPSDWTVKSLLQDLETFFPTLLDRKQLTYRVGACPDVVARADRDKVQQILVNLISNAVKFTDHGEIALGCELRDPWVAISVSDTGRGIPPEHLEQIFEPFVQVDADLTRIAAGTGLGLAISRQLARGMGGDISVKSEPGKGSTFTLMVPRSRSS